MHTHFVKHCLCVHGHVQDIVYNMSSSGSDRKERAYICGNSCLPVSSDSWPACCHAMAWNH